MKFLILAILILSVSIDASGVIGQKSERAKALSRHVTNRLRPLSGQSISGQFEFVPIQRMSQPAIANLEQTQGVQGTKNIQQQSTIQVGTPSPRERMLLEQQQQALQQQIQQQRSGVQVQQMQNSMGQPMQSAQPIQTPMGQPMQSAQPIQTQMGQPMQSAQPIQTQMNQQMPTQMGQPMQSAQSMQTQMNQQMPTQMGQPMPTQMGQPMPTQMGQPIQTPMGQQMPTQMGQPMQTPMGQQMPTQMGQPMQTPMGQPMQSTQQQQRLVQTPVQQQGPSQRELLQQQQQQQELQRLIQAQRTVQQVQAPVQPVQTPVQPQVQVPIQPVVPVRQSGIDFCRNAQQGDIIPHPQFPSQFIICYGFGEFTVMDCPQHLVYNPHLQRCDLHMDEPQMCASNPCQNNGKCVELGSSFRCECPAGFAGIQCERQDSCTAKPCGADGFCLAMQQGSPVTHVCICNGGRSFGSSCAQAEPNPCLTPGSNLRMFSTSLSASVFAHCEGARPHFKFCQAPLVFSTSKQSCDWL